MNIEIIASRIEFSSNSLGKFVSVRNAEGEAILGGYFDNSELDSGYVVSLFFDFGSDAASAAGVSVFADEGFNHDALRAELANKIAASNFAYLIDDSFPMPVSVDSDEDDFYPYD